MTPQPLAMEEVPGRGERAQLVARTWPSLLLAAAVAVTPLDAARAAVVTFDLDSGTPPLSTGQNIPLDQTVESLTAHFSSPQGAAFSIQTDSSTQFRLSQFSGHYLYDNNLDRNVLDIAVSRPIGSISLTFATADFQQVEVPTSIQLTAYLGAIGTQPVGSATAHGTYAGDTMPMGTLTFASGGRPFDVVELVLPFQPQGATDFLVDNISVTTIDVATATPTATSTPTPTATTALCIGDCDGNAMVGVNELITLVNISLGSAPPSDCSQGVPPATPVGIALLIRAVNNALIGCRTS